MKKTVLLSIVVLAFGFMAACSGTSPHHKTPLPDPKSFAGHFGDMDTGGDDRVDWAEFKAHFPHAEPNVFAAIDLNRDEAVDHDEWHAFKEAHGLKDHD